MSDTSNPQADYLRALGHADAADALEAADALVPKSEPGVGHGVPTRAPERQSAAADPEAQRRAEGEVLLRAAREAGIYDR